MLNLMNKSQSFVLIHKSVSFSVVKRNSHWHYQSMPANQHKRISRKLYDDDQSAIDAVKALVEWYKALEFKFESDPRNAGKHYQWMKFTVEDTDEHGEVYDRQLWQDVSEAAPEAAPF